MGCKTWVSFTYLIFILMKWTYLTIGQVLHQHILVHIFGSEYFSILHIEYRHIINLLNNRQSLFCKHFSMMWVMCSSFIEIMKFASGCTDSGTNIGPAEMKWRRFGYSTYIDIDLSSACQQCQVSVKSSSLKRKAFTSLITWTIIIVRFDR